MQVEKDESHSTHNMDGRRGEVQIGDDAKNILPKVIGAIGTAMPALDSLVRIAPKVTRIFK